jgi:hypothetical protein
MIREENREPEIDIHFVLFSVIYYSAEPKGKENTKRCRNRE